MSTINRRIAGRLEEAAELLQAQGADRFRVGAYRRAAAMVRRWPEPLDQVFRSQGLEGVERVPGVGPSIARAIRELITRGRLPMLDRLRGAADPETVLGSVPGIGRTLAERLHVELGIHTLEELEAAAHDGRLDTIAGFGRKRLAGIQDSLAQRLGRVKPDDSRAPRPSVSELLDVDREYRDKAGRGQLPRIAPRRFNPDREAWLPVLHTERRGRRYTALFSNTARAHRLGKTRDWVVIYTDDAGGDHQHTVITAERGPFRGARIVAGREGEFEPSLPVDHETRESRVAALTPEGDDDSGLARRREDAVLGLIPAPSGFEQDQVSEASEESFPASDAPSWTTSTASIRAALLPEVTVAPAICAENSSGD